MGSNNQSLTQEDRYKAQWCGNYIGYPPGLMTEKEILSIVAGTSVEKKFNRQFAIKKAKFEFKKAIKKAAPSWLLKLFKDEG